MPLTHLVDLDGEPIKLDEAPQKFDELGVMPAEAVAAIVESERSEGQWPYVPPSKANPNQTCRRKEVLERFMPFSSTPQAEWKKLEGLFWHRFWELAGLEVRPGWETEVWLPDQPPADQADAECKDDDHPQVRKIQRGKRWIRQLEIWPGLWMHMRLDATNWSSIVDHKSTRMPWHPYQRAPKKDYGDRDAKENWVVALNLYAEAAERLRGCKIEELWVWRYYRGSDLGSTTLPLEDSSLLFRKFPIKRWSEADLRSYVEHHIRSLQGTLEGLLESLQGIEQYSQEWVDAVKDAAKELPLDGQVKNLFGGWLCREGCAVRDLCFRWAGKVTF